MSGNSLLSQIDSPEDLRKLKISELDKLSAEIREEIISVVSSNGGHLAPNLGAVELTVALHYVFNTPSDKLIWDVGHQAYVHKLLTGRREFFKTLRKSDGCLGFLSRAESEYDAFGAGHAGTAISAALGMASARDRKQGKEKVVAIVGDGSLNCGISLEGLNNACEATKDIIIILNDNKMSISPNVGAIPRYLNHLISGKSYNRFKAFAKMMLKRMPGGREIRRKISRIEEATKSLFVPGVFFEELGIRYVGPIPGHDYNELIRALEGIKEFNRPVILHVITEKGRGYSHAEAAPEKFHGLSSFNPETGKSNGKKPDTTYSTAFGLSASRLADAHSELAVISAAMKSGTGLSEFAEKHPEKFYDVGIAEEHALIFAAGLAAEGIRPIVAIYSSFLQRALDCVFHDICLQDLPVIICTDRSGIVDDGPTHHGIHDLSFLRNMPNLSILSPKDENELESMLFAAYDKKAPVLIRYPRGSSGAPSGDAPSIEWGKAELIKDGADLAIWGAGREVFTALETAEMLEKEHGLKVSVVNARFLKPFDSELLKLQSTAMPIASIEDCQVKGGLGSTIDECLINFKHNGAIHFGWGDSIIPHGEVDKIRLKFGMTPDQIKNSVLEFLKEK
jgi:1-deoxy-D-xylulose-5-phosphate synthase